MDVLNGFLRSEINSQELYDSIINFILSFHIRMGEFEGNEYIIKKMDQTNFFIFPEYIYPDGRREIHGTVSIYRKKLISAINNYANRKGLSVFEADWYEE